MESGTICMHDLWNSDVVFERALSSDIVQIKYPDGHFRFVYTNHLPLSPIDTRKRTNFDPIPDQPTDSSTPPLPLPTMPTQPKSPFPTIDISPFLHPSPLSSLHSTSTHISTACANPGFFYLTNHNLPPTLTNRVLSLARDFFLHAPAAEKERIKRLDVGSGGGDGARGYQVIGDNVTEGKRDWHEAIDWYRPVKEGEPFECAVGGDDFAVKSGKNREGPFELLKGMNTWPQYPEGLREVYEEYTEKMCELGTAVVRAMGMALGEGMEDVFVGNTGKSAWVMRAIGYPPLPEDGTKGKEKGGVSCGAHSDYGCVTLLLADGTKGALQAWVENEGEEGRWVDVDPMEGALVVNIGDMMSRWSRGKWKATRHRVVHKGWGYRVSVPFFFEPDWDARVPGKQGEGEVIYGEYLEEKVKGNF